MRFDVITLFPQMFVALTDFGITRRAYERGLWQWHAWNPRDFTEDVHRTVDDRPFGGGPGMVMLAEPLYRAVLAAQAAQREAGCVASRVVALAADGVPVAEAHVSRWLSAGTAESGATGLILVCGRYEGIDQRFLERCVDEEVSVGDVVVSGGEIPAMVLMDAVIRRVPGALKPASVQDESFATGDLAAPVYTRPEIWREVSVPEVLLSGHHAQIESWRRRQSGLRTADRRPDLNVGERRLYDSTDKAKLLQ